MGDPIRIGFTGDVMLGRLVDERYRGRDHDPDAVWNGMLDTLHELDGLVINLECCLSTRGEAWTETYRPFHFRADPSWAVPALEAAGVDAAALANNHVLDFGVPALEDTLTALDDAGIRHAGAGMDRENAWTPTIVPIGGLEVGLVSFTDNTPEYAAGEQSPGTAHVTIDVDDAETRNRVMKAIDVLLDEQPDLVVASLHGGPNMVEEPPADFQEFGRWLVDQGVDLIHGHSAHIFQGIEISDGAPIIYDAGDFVDDYAVDPRLRNDRSFLFEAIVDPESGRITDLQLHPTEIRECAVHPADEEAARWARDRMRSLSAPFGTAFDRTGSGLRCPITGSRGGDRD